MNQDLDGRVSRCGCGKERPSVESVEGKLAFFEFCGPGSREAGRCATCRYMPAAHRHDERRVVSESIVERGECSGYVREGGLDHDRYYCGCRGWD